MLSFFIWILPQIINQNFFLFSCLSIYSLTGSWWQSQSWLRERFSSSRCLYVYISSGKEGWQENFLLAPSRNHGAGNWSIIRKVFGPCPWTKSKLKECDIFLKVEIFLGWQLSEEQFGILTLIFLILQQHSLKKLPFGGSAILEFHLT